MNEQQVRNPRIDRWLKPLAIAAAVGMFIVLLMGATVTNTGSSEGCGRSWPMCGGDMWSREMLIEASHRLVTGIEGFLVLGVGIGLWRSRGDRREARLLIAGMWGAILVQSGMGAWAVRSPQNSWVMALHFGFSVIAFASCVLTVEMIYRDERGSARHLQWSVPAGFKYLMWFTLIASYGIAYLGAYVRHSDAVIACATWPDCNGKVIPELSGPVGIHFAHRVAALGGMLLVFSLAGMVPPVPRRAARYLPDLPGGVGGDSGPGVRRGDRDLDHAFLCFHAAPRRIDGDAFCASLCRLPARSACSRTGAIGSAPQSWRNRCAGEVITDVIEGYGHGTAPRILAVNHRGK